MKAGIELDVLAARLEEQQESKVDFVLNTRRMQIATATDGGRSTLSLDAAGSDGVSIEDFAVTDHTHGQLAERLGVPKDFYDRLRFGHKPRRGKAKKAQPELFDQLVNGLFNHAPERRMVRTLDGKARAYVSSRYRRIDNLDVANRVLPIVGEFQRRYDAQIMSANMTDARLYLKVVLPRIYTEVKVGDVVQSGFVVTNSEIGLGSCSVSPLVFRLDCLNGMTRPAEGVRQFHVGAESEEMREVYSDRTLRAEDKAFLLKVEDMVKAAASDSVFLQIVKRMKDAADSEPMDDPVGGVERLASKLQLQEGEKKSVLRHLIEGGDLSAYGALNAITRTSQDVPDYDRASELERLGGDVLDLSKSDWHGIAISA